jgi:RHS repeat-associated protein
MTVRVTCGLAATSASWAAITAGVPTSRYYDAWGNPETAGGLTVSTPFGYAGGYTDPDSLVYLLARYYAPASGQFISVDPLLSQTMQPYAYADGNPVSYVDPSGQARLNWWPDWKTVLELRLNKRETALVWMVIIKLHLPSVLTFLHLLPSWMRDLLINVLVRGLINVIPAAAHAIVTNGCLKFDFRWWGALDLGVCYSSWTGCTGSYWPEIRR